MLGVAFCNGLLYASDTNNNRIEKFSVEGKYEGQFGKAGSGNGEFNAPSRIACEPTGNDLYVTDKGNNRVQEFTATGVFVGKFGVVGHEAGQLTTPVGVAVGAAGSVYVVDSGNYRVEKWLPTYSTNNPLPEPPTVGTNSVLRSSMVSRYQVAVLRTKWEKLKSKHGAKKTIRNTQQRSLRQTNR